MRDIHFREAPAKLMPDIFESMFLSEFAPDTHPGEIARIVRVSRTNNAAAGITGLMMFDGSLFCQDLEGPERAVRDMIARIARDPRHRTFLPLHHAPLEKTRRFDSWHVGILAPSGPSPLLAFRSLNGQQAVEHMVSIFLDSENFGIHVI